MEKKHAKIGLKVHPVGRGNVVLYINEIGDKGAGCSYTKNSKSNFSINYEKLVVFKNQS